MERESDLVRKDCGAHLMLAIDEKYPNSSAPFWALGLAFFIFFLKEGLAFLKCHFLIESTVKLYNYWLY